MRLTSEQVDIIKSTVRDVCGADVTVRLFGSRVDDHKKGGDIDLLIESALPIENQVMLECQLASKFYFALDERKVDVLVIAPNIQLLPIHQVALEEGIVL